jgi:RNA polymerase sigma-70 factor, ECF subfamily
VPVSGPGAPATDLGTPEPGLTDPGITEAGTAGLGELDDATLAIRAGEGDADAFEQLVIRYQGPVYRLALRMLGNAAEAEDVTQDAFLSAWRGLASLRARAAFSGWLYRMTVNRCLNVLRGQRPVAELDPEMLRAARPEEQPETAAETGAQVAALSVALAQLTPEQRACWVLRELHGCSYEEIAGIVSASTTAVRGRIARSRAVLAEVMRPWQ